MRNQPNLRFKSQVILNKTKDRQTSLVGKVVAGAAATAALDERRRPEVLEARPRAGQQLPAPLGPGGSVLE